MNGNREGEGFRAEVQADNRHLVLLSTWSALGWRAAIFDASANAEIVSEFVDNADDGMRRAEELARAIMRPLPALDWQPTPRGGV